MRAKSIKNKARVNAELSPAELKALLKKAQRDHANAGAYIGLLEQEVGIWRSGGTVDKEQWASMEKALGLAPGELEKLVAPPALPPKASGGSGTSTPRVPALDRVGEADGMSRPMTPSVERDEREEWLKRENDLGDQLAKAVSFVVGRVVALVLTPRVDDRNRKSSTRKSSFASCETRSLRSRSQRRPPRPRTRR